MLNVNQIVQDAAQYPVLDVHLYALMRLVQQNLQASEIHFRDGVFTLIYNDDDNDYAWLLKLTSGGLRLAQRVWSRDAHDVISSLLNIPIVNNVVLDWRYPLFTYNNYMLTYMLDGVEHCIEPSKVLYDLFVEVDACLASKTPKTPPNTRNSPVYGDAQGSGINVHSQGELYPLYHMHWRGQDWLCYANHAVPEKQFKQELLALPPHDRTAFVVQYGVEIRPTKPEEKGCKSSVWPLEIREDKQRGMVFTWANRWMPYNKEFHKFLEGRTSDQRRMCIQVVGDVIA